MCGLDRRVVRGLVVPEAFRPPVLQPAGPKGEVEAASVQIAVVDQDVEHHVDPSTSIRHQAGEVQLQAVPCMRREHVMRRGFGEDRHSDLEVAVLFQSVAKALRVVKEVGFAGGSQHLGAVDVGNILGRNAL